MSCRRQSYHSQTSAGSRANASGVASSSTRKCFQRPSAPLNVGTPLAAETPAPVITVTRRAPVSASTRGLRHYGLGSSALRTLATTVKLGSTTFATSYSSAWPMNACAPRSEKP